MRTGAGRVTARALDPARLEEGHRVPLAAAHDGDSAGASEDASFSRTEDSATREYRDDARDLQGRRRNRRDARGSRVSTLPAAAGPACWPTRSAARGTRAIRAARAPRSRPLPARA